MPLFRLPLLIAFAAATGAGWLPAHGQPDNPIVIINSYPPIGPAEIAGSASINKILKIMQNFAAPSITDVMALRAGDALGITLDRIVAVERRSRERSLQAARHVVNAAPDGHTLLFSSSIEMVTNPRLFKLSYVPLRDLVPVAVVARMPVVVISAASGGFDSVQAYVAAARANPGKLNYGSSGDFRTGHLAGELFSGRAGIVAVHVPFNGGNEAVSGVLKGQLAVAFVPLPSVLPALPGGKIRVLGIADAARHETLPHVPTVEETGVRGFEAASWYGIFAPAGTPVVLVAQFNDGIVTGLRMLRAEQLLLSHGLQVQNHTAGEFGELMRAEHRKWGPVIDGLKPPF
jgi:tripartite-type tricarboxylate transporter receptor subunit TctC